MANENEHHEQARTSTIHQPTQSAVRKNDAETTELTHADSWQALKRFTHARIALGRVGSSLPTKEILDFGLCHAMARDAVHLQLNVETVASKISALGFTTLHLHSQAPDRTSFLLRPDWGRKLNESSREKLISLKATSPIDFLLVVGDGLSALAIEKQAVPLLEEIQKNLPAEWTTGAIMIVSQARVAIADEIAELMGARAVCILIGERPGLSSPDSLGIYFTYNPRIGSTDADRNCISNIRPEGLAYEIAAKKLIWLAKEAMRLKLSGVALKDESNIQDVTADSRLSTTPLASNETS